MLEQKRLLGIDFGEKRVGIAITDPLRIFAYALVTIQNDNNFWKVFNQLFIDYDIETIVLGYPLKESGERSSSTDLIEKFKTELETHTKIPIVLIDERYTSVIAQQQVLESVTSKKKRRDKGLVDKNAAAIILKEYLESIN
ncbi:MAG: Holliday junction resolvase RuvX [Bacteroidetes bacterium]|nr:Holliday junction resolvase RuvX [Bacteroidota bacterium]MBU1115371.1 Holliday junction resolvase RuvX [Bacteroidota bacterium]MBU1797892.1 Holliday junction resolvase RuvX [Bacteroidota bacterium]